MSKTNITAVRNLLVLILLAAHPIAVVANVRVAKANSFDVIIRGGTVYDGTGGAGRRVRGSNGPGTLRVSSTL
jgi:hypothetical protein